MIKRAVLSVSDKTGIVDFARELTALGIEIISTGGTYKAIKEAGIPVIYITEITGFPEILDGRVKTLHPFIHGGILARRSPEHLAQLNSLGIAPVDLVAVNLYPFRQTINKPAASLEEAVENIDIGGPAMVRAAAKNHKDVLVIVNPKDYPMLIKKIKEGEVDYQTRLELALAAYKHTAEYDACIAKYLEKKTNKQELLPETALILGEKAQGLRYGENPHQKAAFYRIPGYQGASISNARQLQGKELSFNNIVDINAALELVKEFKEPAAVIVKHTNPCGTALGEDINQAYERALAADPVSAYGGIAALNREVNEDLAKEMKKLFLEAIIAPGFSPAALNIFSAKANLRLLAVGEINKQAEDFDLKKVAGGFLIQDTDSELMAAEEIKIVSKRRPTPEEMEELLFAWKIVKHIKSNAIVVTKERQSIGVGAGQMNRVGAAEIAFKQGGANCQNAVLASDAYFPFRDTVDAAYGAGITAVIQPGGSIRDEESIAAADEKGMAMVFTGMRHFKH